MACGRREACRRHALDVASCSWTENARRIDWGRFIRTGAIERKKQTRSRALDDPDVRRKMAEIDANGGKLIVG